MIYDAVAKHCYLWAGVLAVVYTATPAVTSGIAAAPDLFQKIFLFTAKSVRRKVGF
jgi:hypothetical protein